MDKQEIVKLIADVQSNSAENFKWAFDRLTKLETPTASETAKEKTVTEETCLISTESLRKAKVWPSQAYVVAEGKPIPVLADLEPFIEGKVYRRPAPTHFNLVCDLKHGIRRVSCIRALAWGGGDVAFLGLDFVSVTDTTPMRLRIGGNQTIDIGDYLCQTADGIVFGLSNRAFSALFDVVGNTTESD